MIFMLFLILILGILTYLAIRIPPDPRENYCPWCGGSGCSDQGIPCFKCGGSGVKND